MADKREYRVRAWNQWRNAWMSWKVASEKAAVEDAAEYRESHKVEAHAESREVGEWQPIDKEA